MFIFMLFTLDKKDFFGPLSQQISDYVYDYTYIKYMKFLNRIFFFFNKNKFSVSVRENKKIYFLR